MKKNILNIVTGLLLVIFVTACTSHTAAPHYGCKTGECLSASSSLDWLENRNNDYKNYDSVTLYWFDEEETEKQIIFLKDVQNK